MRRRAGLTFVELLVAATIFAILAAGLSLQLRGGLDVWRRISDVMDTSQRLRVMSDRLRQELANAVEIATEEQSPAAPVFREDAIAFVTSLPPASAESARRLRYVRYEKRQDQLVRTECGFQEALAGRFGEPQVMADPAQFAVRYGYQPGPDSSEIVWQHAWANPSRLPRLVAADVSIGGQVWSPWMLIPQGLWHTVQEADTAAVVGAPGAADVSP